MSGQVIHEIESSDGNCELVQATDLDMTVGEYTIRWSHVARVPLLRIDVFIIVQIVNSVFGGHLSKVYILQTSAMRS